MNVERLESLLQNGVSHDTETWLIKPGLAAPKRVCWSAGWYDADAKQCVGQIGPDEDGDEAFERLLDDESIVVVGANYSFDILVCLVAAARRGKDLFPKVRKMLEDGRVFDIQLAEQLHAIAMGHLGKDPRTKQDIVNPETGKKGRYSLAACVDMVLGRGDAKANDEWRLRYAELDGIPIDQWPAAARDYPVDDARNTLECALAQTGHLPRVVMQHAWEMQPSGLNTCVRCGKETFGGTCWDHRANQNLHDLAHQQRANTALALAGAWGFRVDQAKVDVIEKHAIKNRDDGAGPFVAAGIIRKDGTENQSELKRRVAVAYGAKSKCPVCTGTGKVPSPSAKPVRCRKCKGAGLNCDECHGEGKKVYALINCCEVPDASNPKGKIKTCDGTGLLLTDDVPRTDGNGVGAGRDLLYESGDPTLQAYAEYCADDKVLATYVPYLRGARTCVDCGAAGTEKSPHTCETGHIDGNRYRDVPLTLQYNSLVESGRVSASGAIQLFPRWPGYWDNDADEYVPSLRECLVPRGPQYEVVEVPDDYVLQPGEERVE